MPRTGIAGNTIQYPLRPAHVKIRTIKISANPQSCARLHGQIDFPADAVLTGREAPEAQADRLIAAMLGVAGGDLTLGEILGEGDEVVSRFGAAL